jgi:hypothetical protein
MNILGVEIPEELVTKTVESAEESPLVSIPDCVAHFGPDKVVELCNREKKKIQDSCDRRDVTLSALQEFVENYKNEAPYRRKREFWEKAKTAIENNAV